VPEAPTSAVSPAEATHSDATAAADSEPAPAIAETTPASSEAGASVPETKDQPTAAASENASEPEVQTPAQEQKPQEEPTQDRQPKAQADDAAPAAAASSSSSGEKAPETQPQESTAQQAEATSVQEQQQTQTEEAAQESAETPDGKRLNSSLSLTLSFQLLCLSAGAEPLVSLGHPPSRERHSGRDPAASDGRNYRGKSSICASPVVFAFLVVFVVLRALHFNGDSVVVQAASEPAAQDQTALATEPAAVSDSGPVAASVASDVNAGTLASASATAAAPSETITLPPSPRGKKKGAYIQKKRSSGVETPAPAPAPAPVETADTGSTFFFFPRNYELCVV
jgi:hypothetical protein